jgi:ATP-dependent helicase/nuclease subunit A
MSAPVRIPIQANTGVPSLEAIDQMSRRRHQNPKLEKHGKFWTIIVRKDEFVDGKPVRCRTRVRIAPVTTPMRQVLKMKDEYLRPINQGLTAIGSATNFRKYVEDYYVALEMPTLAKPTQDRYRGVIDNYLLPVFGSMTLRDLTPAKIQLYFSSMADSELSYESRDKIRDVLASVLRTAWRKYRLIAENPMENIELPRPRMGRSRSKPHITPEQFDQLLEHTPEPYATMVYVAIYTGLRVSELIGLKWGDVGAESLTVDERCCRGDWSEPKSKASNATIAVDLHVIERIHRLRLLTVEVRAGRATRKYKVVKSDGPNDLVFQSVKDGKPMRDNNILCRFIKPAGRRLGFGFVNWRSLRTSRATWMIEAGANPKDVQSQMRHERIHTTLDIYAQFVPESQKRAIAQTSAMAFERIAAARAARPN